MQSNEGEGAKSKGSGSRGYLGGPGVSESYMAAGRTSTKPTPGCFQSAGKWTSGPLCGRISVGSEVCLEGG